MIWIQIFPLLRILKIDKKQNLYQAQLNAFMTLKNTTLKKLSGSLQYISGGKFEC